MRFPSGFFLAAVVSLFPSPVRAQADPLPAGGGPALLIRSARVQDELKLDDGQRARVKEAMDQVWKRQREKWNRLLARGNEEGSGLLPAETRAALADETLDALSAVLRPEQLRRLRQIDLQQRGTEAFLDPRVRQALQLTAEQADRVKELRRESGDQLRQLAESAKQQPQETARRLERLRRQAIDQATAVLTSEQKQAWALMTGEPASRDVAEELKLSKEQKDKVKQAFAGVRAKHREELRQWELVSLEKRTSAASSELRRSLTAETIQALGDVLKPEQLRRLKQIELRDRGAAALLDPAVVKALNVTAEQQGRVKALSRDGGAELQKLLRQPSGDAVGTARKAAAVKKAALEKAVALLTAEQREAWELLAGEPVAADKDVEDALQLSPDQREQVKAAVEKVRAKHRDDVRSLRRSESRQRAQLVAEFREGLAADTWKALDGVLTARQLQRLRQIDLQGRGTRAFLDPEVQKALRLTGQQKDRLKQLRQEAAREARNARTDADAAQRAQALAALQRRALDRAVSLLNEDQLQAWKDLIGSPLTPVPDAAPAERKGPDAGPIGD